MKFKNRGNNNKEISLNCKFKLQLKIKDNMKKLLKKLKIAQMGLCKHYVKGEILLISKKGFNVRI